MNIQTFHSSSTGNLYRISDLNTRLLIDPGVPLSQIKRDLDFRLSEIAACLLTHAHKDHSKGVWGLAQSGIDIYLTKGTLDALELNGHRFHIIEAGKQFRIGTWEILPFATIHNAKEPVGFLLISGTEKLLFATDTQYIRPRFKGMTHIMVEANYELEALRNSDLSMEVKRNILAGHMSIETAKQFFRMNDMSKVQEIHLLHLSQNNSNAEHFQDEIMRISGRPVYIGG